MRLALFLLGTEVFAVELDGSRDDEPALEGGAGGWFEVAPPADPDPDAFGFGRSP